MRRFFVFHPLKSSQIMASAVLGHLPLMIWRLFVRNSMCSTDHWDAYWTGLGVSPCLSSTSLTVFVFSMSRSQGWKPDFVLIHSLTYWSSAIYRPQNLMTMLEIQRFHLWHSFVFIGVCANISSFVWMSPRPTLEGNGKIGVDNPLVHQSSVE